MTPIQGTKTYTASAFTTELSLGSKGNDVAAVQQLLNQAGAKLNVDGDWGPKTDAAVRDFQRQHGLKVDGIVGPKTVAALLGTQSVSKSDAAKPATTGHLDLNRELSSPDSRLSIAIGNAEGTRTPDGARTAAYQGHTDPNNGAHNVGTFSFQHGAASPADADHRQLLEFKKIQPQFEAACRANNLDPSNPMLAATCFDLYNQAPKAVTGKGGFLDKLPELAKNGISRETLAQARYESFFDPDKGKFDTTFKSLADLKADQQRRTDKLSEVLGAPQPAAAPSAAATPVPEGKIGLNSSGPEVAQLKQILKDAGFYHGPVNETMGNQGIDALRRAKQALHLGGPADIAGPETIQKLTEYVKNAPNLHVNVGFVSQFDSRVPGDYPGQDAKLKCDNACQYMMEHNQEGARVTPGVGDASIKPYGAHGPADATVRYIQSELEAKRPVMIGVNHPRGNPNAGNKNGINHFLVATGMGVDEKGRRYITFHDPAQQSEAAGRDTNPENRLYLKNGQFEQDRASDPYQFRGVVDNPR